MVGGESATASFLINLVKTLWTCPSCCDFFGFVCWGRGRGVLLIFFFFGLFRIEK